MYYLSLPTSQTPNASAAPDLPTPFLRDASGLMHHLRLSRSPLVPARYHSCVMHQARLMHHLWLSRAPPFIRDASGLLSRETNASLPPHAAGSRPPTTDDASGEHPAKVMHHSHAAGTCLCLARIMHHSRHTPLVPACRQPMMHHLVCCPPPFLRDASGEHLTKVMHHSRMPLVPARGHGQLMHHHWYPPATISM